MAVLDFAAHTLDYLHVTDGYEDDNGITFKAQKNGWRTIVSVILFLQARQTLSLSPMVLQRTIPTPSTTFLEHAVISSMETKSV